VEHPRELRFGSDDIVLLAMKTQHTAAALADLAETAPADLPIACAQNGVENERLALRRFERVFGISVMCPALYLTPGHVQAFGTPRTGILDVGVYPRGSDSLCQQLSAAFRSARFDSEVRDDILRFKYGKLLFNLGNAIEAVCGPAARKGPIADRVRQEAIAAFRAAGVDFDAEGAAARGEQVKPQPLGSSARPGGSSWQSLTRRAGSIETDYLNGEIVLLGRSAGVPTPANALLQRLSNELAHAGSPPGALTPDAFLAQL
jgi:2-dehydropantoate 2-reductase